MIRDKKFEEQNKTLSEQCAQIKSLALNVRRTIYRLLGNNPMETN